MGLDREPDYGRHAEYKRRDRLLPWPKVRDLYGISRTTAWRLQKVGEFPQPVHISAGRVGWRESELIAWAASRTHRAHAAVKTPASGAGQSPAETGQRVAPASAPRPRSRPRPQAEGQTAFEF